VGKETNTPPRSFFVHVELLTSRSTFFAKALRKYARANQSDEDTNMQSSEDQSIQWREGEEGVVKMPADEPDVFANYVQLLYTRVLPICDDAKLPKMNPATMTEDEVEKIKTSFNELVVIAVDEMYTTLGKLYVFCEKIRDATAKQALLATFVEESSRIRSDGMEQYPDTCVIRDIYSGTLPSDPLRAFLADCYAYEGNSEWAGKDYKDLPHEFLHDLVVGMYEVRPGPKNLGKLKNTKYYLDKLTEFEEGKAEEEISAEGMEVEKEVE
jgi:hypothetical protein